MPHKHYIKSGVYIKSFCKEGIHIEVVSPFKHIAISTFTHALLKAGVELFATFPNETHTGMQPCWLTWLCPLCSRYSHPPLYTCAWWCHLVDSHLWQHAVQGSVSQCVWIVWCARCHESNSVMWHHAQQAFGSDQYFAASVLYLLIYTLMPGYKICFNPLVATTRGLHYITPHCPTTNY